MTELLYFKDCYMKEFDAEVIDIKNGRLVLDRTAFYPEGGGQPSDTGKIDNVKVKKVEKRETRFCTLWKMVNLRLVRQFMESSIG